MTEDTRRTTDLSGLSSLRRWLLATVGVFFVGLAALGAVLPGLPTTIFLILASWCFARSCPWLERKLVQARLFRPFRPYLQPGARMPRRAQATALALMWTAIAVSLATVVSAGAGGPAASAEAAAGGGPSAGTWALAATIVAAGGGGTFAILRAGRRGPDRRP
jgi:uncharacterized protein